MAQRTLNGLTAEPGDSPIYRYANPRRTEAALRRMGLSEGSVAALTTATTLEEEILDDPFRPRSRLPDGSRPWWEEGRFSDGSFPVFYAADSEATARAEKAHQAGGYARSKGGSWTFHYRCFECDFDGRIRDLTGVGWSELVGDADDDLATCRGLGREAVDDHETDGLRVPSARDSDGRCRPTFTREALSSPTLVGSVAVNYDSATGTVSVGPFNDHTA